MAINWDEVRRAISPTKNYDELCQRLKNSLSYPFVYDSYNFPLPTLRDYTDRLLGGDPRGRYVDYNTTLNGILARLPHAGVDDVATLVEKTSTKAQLESLVLLSGISAVDISIVLKYLLYWVIPTEKYLAGLVQSGIQLHEAVIKLREIDIRYTLQLIQLGLSNASRKALAQRCGVSIATLTELVNRADFSRLPWASKATISNIIGAGYSSLARLADADLDRLIADFFRYGTSIGKNLKFGNEIENSYRIAKILPRVIHGV